MKPEHASSTGGLVGRAVRRREDARLLTGRGRYTDDLRFAGELYAAFVRSEHAHARIDAVDSGPARAAAGTVAVYTGGDLADLGVGELRCMVQGAETRNTPFATPPRRPLAGECVRHVGEPLAMVVSASADAALDAAEQVRVDYRPLPAVIDPVAALAAGAPRLHEAAPGNLCLRWQAGDAPAVERAFDSAAHTVAVETRNNRLTSSPMEPRAAVAVPAPDGRVVLHTASQGVHALRMLLAECLHMPESALRVITADVGGSFGTKMYPYPEHAMLIAAARALGRPVRWTASRSESFLADNHARDVQTRAELALSPQGRFLAVRVRTIANLGAYVSGFGPLLPTRIASRALLGPYATPAAHVSVDVAFTNTAPVDAYRGAGRPEAVYVMERLADLAARKLAIDPADLRRRNLVGPESMPYTTALGQTYDSGDFPAVLARALERAEWSGFPARRRAARERGLLRGIGLSCFVEPAGGERDQHATIRFTPDGSTLVLVGAQSAGSGHETVYAQIAAERLGLPMEAVRVIQGDSDVVPHGSWTSGSRGLTDGGSAVVLAAERLLARATRIAAHLLQARPPEVSYHEGVFRAVDGSRSVTLQEVVRSAFEFRRIPAEMEPGLEATAVFVARAGTYPNGCCVAEVEVDPETGGVRLAALTAADDFGRVVNPLIVEGQVHGGLAQGAGQALFEHCVYDAASGQLLSGSFLDYALPRAADLPGLATAHLEVPATTNPLGAKGCGEAGAIGAPPAVMNAVLDALREAGVDALDMPATPHRVWQALRAARRGRNS